MIHHVVLFRFKPGVSPEQIAAAGRGMMTLKGAIAEVRSIDWVANQAPSAGEYPWALFATFEDMAGVQRYQDHPAHVEAVGRWLAPIRESRLAVDFEAS
jgi:hypothetical protein